MLLRGACLDALGLRELAKPMIIGDRIAYAPGAIISVTLLRVLIATHLSESGITSAPQNVPARARV